MGILTPSILFARVGHKRLLPKQNQFSYHLYYVAIPLKMIDDASLDAILPLNRFSLQSFYAKDHGFRDGRPLTEWAREVLRCYSVKGVKYITLICMPRVFGYVFNPVSFWLCYDTEEQLKAVICEVDNTFGETHSYVCAHPDGKVITKDDWLHAQKEFHVSPFLEREGSYNFHFELEQENCTIHINHQGENNEKLLVTVVNGTFKPLSKKALRSAFMTHPLLTLKVILLIHFQAFKLTLKRVRYISKPMQKKNKQSGCEK